MDWLSNSMGLFLRYILSLAVIAWLIWQLKNLDWQHWRLIDVRLLAPAAVLALAAYSLQAWRWLALLRALGIKSPARWVHGVFWIGTFYNSFLPSGVAGDAVRLAYLWKNDPERKALGATSLLLDRLIGFGALFVLAAVALGLHTVSGQPSSVTGMRSLLVASTCTCVLLVLSVWSVLKTRWWEPISARVLGANRARRLHDATVALGQKRGKLGLAVALSFAVWLMDFLSLFLLARSVGLDVSWLTISIAASAAYVTAILPVSVGGHGLREGTLVGMLTLLTGGQAAVESTSLLALLFLVLTLCSSLVGGFVYLGFMLTGWSSVTPTEARS
ncbi:MAG: lysylphosphatidylglycerol synthase transmembrane domain-containing protein [Nibricoccus sp.]